MNTSYHMARHYRLQADSFRELANARRLEGRPDPEVESIDVLAAEYERMAARAESRVHETEVSA